MKLFDFEINNKYYEFGNALEMCFSFNLPIMPGGQGRFCSDPVTVLNQVMPLTSSSS